MSLISPRKYKKYTLVLYRKKTGFWLFTTGSGFDKIPIIKIKGWFRRRYAVVDFLKFECEDMIYGNIVQIRMEMDMAGLQDIGLIVIDANRFRHIFCDDRTSIFRDFDRYGHETKEWPMGTYFNLDPVKVDEEEFSTV